MNRLFKRWFALLLSALMITGFGINAVTIRTLADGQGTTYYVDSAGGNDSNSGTSEQAAWQTIDKVNGMTFNPGDKILLKRGSIWNGRLSPKGSGSANAPIIIDTYGQGARPIIDAGGKSNSALYLKNQQYWEVNGLELTNKGSGDAVRRGVYVYGENSGDLEHIYLKNLYIHDVRGDDTFSGTGKGTGGIYFEVVVDQSQGLDAATKTKFDDVQIENCQITNVGRTGISFFTGWQKAEWKYWATKVLIKNNFIDHVRGDGMIFLGVDSPIIEYNTVKDANFACGPNRQDGWAVGMFPFFSNNALIQYNEIYNTRSTQDGEAIDIDGNNTGAIVQYNYTHDNEGGAFLVMVDNWAKGSRTTNTTIRYNISQNDRHRVFTISNVSDVKVYNNTIYIGNGLNTTVLWHKAPGTGKVNGATVNVPAVDKIAYSNNLIINFGSGDYQTQYGTNVSFNNNWYYGNHPATEPAEQGKEQRMFDPMLNNPGNGATGIKLDDRANILPEYTLKAYSPLIDAGVKIDGVDYSNLKDFWGNNALYGATPDIGANEFQGTKQNSAPSGTPLAAGTPVPDLPPAVTPGPAAADTAMGTADTGAPQGPPLFEYGGEDNQPKPKFEIVSGDTTTTNNNFSLSTDQKVDGTSSIKYSGTSPDSTGKASCILFDNLNITCNKDTKLSFYIYPLNEAGKHVSIDFQYVKKPEFNNGVTGELGWGRRLTGMLDDKGNDVRATAGHGDIPLNQWSQITTTLGKKGELVGTQIKCISIRFDGAQGDFGGYIDDIVLTDYSVASHATAAGNPANSSKTGSAAPSNMAGTTSGEFSQGDITKELSQSQIYMNGVRVIEYSFDKNSTAACYDLSLPIKAVSSDSLDYYIRIDNSIADLLLPSDSFVSNAASQPVDVIVKQTDKVPKDCKLSFEITAKLGNDDVQLKGIGSPFKVIVPYILPQGESADSLTVFNIDASGRTSSIEGARYDMATKTLMFDTTRLGDFEVYSLTKTFNDLQNVGWAEKQIRLLAAKNIVTGTADNDFMPGEDITRADFITMLVRALGLTTDFEDNFTDVSNTDYYWKPVGIAKKLGIITGESDNSFKPQSLITRQDMAVIAYRALTSIQKLNQPADDKALSKFTDNADISSYAKSGMAALVSAGILSGDNNSLINPLAPATRAQAAVFIYNMYSMIN